DVGHHAARLGQQGGARGDVPFALGAGGERSVRLARRHQRELIGDAADRVGGKLILVCLPLAARCLAAAGEHDGAREAGGGGHVHGTVVEVASCAACSPE